MEPIGQPSLSPRADLEEVKRTNAKLDVIIQKLDMIVELLRYQAPPVVYSRLAVLTEDQCLQDGDAAKKEDRLEEAESHYSKALELAKDSSHSKARVLWRLGNLAKEKGDIFKAKTLFLQASACTTLSSKLGIQLVLTLGDIERQQRDFSKARDYYWSVYKRQVFSSLLPESTAEQKSRACFGLGDTHKNMNEYDDAKKYFLEAITFTSSNTVKFDAYCRLVEIAKAQKNTGEEREYCLKMMSFEMMCR